MSTKTKTATNKTVINGTPSGAPQTRPHNPERYSAFVEAARKAVDDRLEGYFEDFLKNGLPEEKSFLNEVFCWWESGFTHSGTKGSGQHEVPLFSCIQDQLDGMHLVPVESEAMVVEVEKFITEKIASGWKRPAYKPSIRESEEQIMDRLSALVARQVQFFSSRCKRTDLIFLIDILEQWETLTDNPEFWKNTEYPLAAAAEIHLDVMKRREREMAAHGAKGV